jgi:hypothetical protein
VKLINAPVVRRFGPDLPNDDVLVSVLVYIRHTLILWRYFFYNKKVEIVDVATLKLESRRDITFIEIVT